MANNSKKHHFVPRSILRNFHDVNEKLFVFDKLNEKSFPSNADNIGHENDFNSILIEGNKINFEDAFQDVDNITSILIRKILLNEKDFHLTIDEFYNLALITLVQQMRTKLPRTTMIELSKEINDWMGNFDASNLSGIGGHDKLILPTDEEDSKLVSLSGFENMEEKIKILLSKGLVLFRTSETKPFWTSDNPVVINNEFPYGRKGLKEPGTDVYFPISKCLMLGFICKIKCEQIFESYWKSVLVNEPVSKIVSNYFKGIYKSNIIDLDKGNVDYFNSLQVLNSSRFIYSSQNDFFIAKDMIKENPDLKQIRKTLTIGNSGYSGMPEGEHIVFYLDNEHFMVPVNLIMYPYDLEFYCSDRRLVRLFNTQTVIKNIEIFKSKILVRRMQEVIITEMENLSNKFTIKHKDEGVRAIIDHVKQSRGKKI